MSGSDLALFVWTYGPGVAPVTLLCLHGVEAHGLRFTTLATHLATLVPGGVRVSAPDLRGHGRSPHVGPWTVEQHVEDVVRVLESLEQPPVLLGHSYGGLLAWEVARAVPDRLAALVMVDPAIAVSAELARASVTYEHSSIGHSWPDVAAVLADYAVGRTADGLASAALDAAVNVQRDADGMLRSRASADAVRAAWDHMQQPLRPTRWRGPTLLVEAGREHGAFVSPGVAADMRAQLGSALEHVVLDAPHIIPSDYPADLGAVLAPFLARVSAGGA